MAPSTPLSLWIQVQLRSNTLVSFVTAPRTRVSFPNGINEISLACDSESGLFLSTGDCSALVISFEPRLAALT